MNPHKMYPLPNQKRRVKGDYLDMKRMCLRKVPLVSMQEAIEFANSANNDPNNPDRHVKRMEAYECPYCQFFHIGRKRLPKRYEEDRDMEELYLLGLGMREVRAMMRENVTVRHGKVGPIKRRRIYLRDICRMAFRNKSNPNARANFKAYIKECDKVIKW